MGAPKKAPELSRAERKSKKRQAEDAIPDLPGDDDNDGEEVQVSEAEKPSKKRKRNSENKNSEADSEAVERKAAKRDKKRKRTEEKECDETKTIEVEEDEAEKKKKRKDKNEVCEGEGKSAVAEDDDTAGPKKSKKERKAERKAREVAEGLTKESKKATPTEVGPEAVLIAVSEAGAGDKPKKKNNNRNRDKKRKAKAEAGEESKAARFIVFIGNLPYSATKESITKHFASVKPISVRHSTQKENPSKSKGFAFLEFEGYDHMKTCLKLFHHSMFDDGVSPARKLNVELTAGGGGNTQDRKSKIEEKNQKLNEQRVRRIQEEEKAKFAKAAESNPDASGIHPSRRAIIPGA